MSFFSSLLPPFIIHNIVMIGKSWLSSSNTVGHISLFSAYWCQKKKHFITKHQLLVSERAQSLSPEGIHKEECIIDSDSLGAMCKYV